MDGNKKASTNTLIIAGTLLFFAVAIGAFGAHGLEGKVSEKAMATFQTGSRYHFFHALALMGFGIIQMIFPQTDLKKAVVFNLIGITLFSFNCYLYAILGIKTFAMIVPLGGISFLVSWFLFTRQMFRLN